MAYCIANVKTVSSVASMRSIQDERLREKEFCNVDKVPKLEGRQMIMFLTSKVPPKSN